MITLGFIPSQRGWFLRLTLFYMGIYHLITMFEACLMGMLIINGEGIRNYESNIMPTYHYFVLCVSTTKHIDMVFNYTLWIIYEIVPDVKFTESHPSKDHVIYLNYLAQLNMYIYIYGRFGIVTQTNHEIYIYIYIWYLFF